MDITNWDSVLQFTSGANMEFGLQDHDFPEQSTSSTPNLQVPTPPHSTDGGSPICDDPSDNNVLVSISTTFYPGANLHSLPPDLALLSTDSVFFYVHSHIILAAMFFLHIGRSDALKRILLQPPHPHAPTPWCDFADQKNLTRAWALASAYLAWDARPDVSTGFLEAALTPLVEHLSCDLCKQGLKDRIKNLIVQCGEMNTVDLDSIFQFPTTNLDLPENGLGTFSTVELQVPTPPDSSPGSPISDVLNDAQVSISTAFHLDAHWQHSPPDFALLSSDLVTFYVHLQVMLSGSKNSFRSLLPICPPDVPTSTLAQSREYLFNTAIHVPESSQVLNIILHAIYAVSASPHLLSFSLLTLTDEMAKEIGSTYLRKMFFLHMGRVDALKRLLLQPPSLHAPIRGCVFADQRTLTRAWALASAYVAWDARPDISKSFLESSLTPLAEHLTCKLCKKSLNERIRDLVVHWSIRTI
ncbi:hypothetical protein LENED_011619 [Lentinula edodes]|uniref:Uncharacterized protein n=1 Tax=Lentinula edodes TaxID=5353 RepID=A0A1Q3EQT9_LENED|nr:hypothetical protein LENED_011619 [Lentinula edodes]